METHKDLTFVFLTEVNDCNGDKDLLRWQCTMGFFASFKCKLAVIKHAPLRNTK